MARALADSSAFVRAIEPAEDFGLQIQQHRLSPGSRVRSRGSKNRQRFVEETRTHQVEREVEQKLAALRWHQCPLRQPQRLKMSRGSSARVSSRKAAASCVTAESPQHESAEVARIEVVGLGAQRPVKVLKRGRPVSASAVDFRKSVISRSAPRSVPRALVEGPVGFVWTIHI